MEDSEVVLAILSLPDRMFADFSEAMRRDEDDNIQHVIEEYGDLLEGATHYMFADMLERATEAGLSRAFVVMMIIMFPESPLGDTTAQAKRIEEMISKLIGTGDERMSDEQMAAAAQQAADNDGEEASGIDRG